MNISVYIIYMDNINEDVIAHQKRVLQNLCANAQVNYAKTEGTHADAMDYIMRTATTDVVVFLDVDAIPLTTDAVRFLANKAYTSNTIAGAPQRANHIDNDKHIYVGPCVLAIPTALYKQIRQPSARETWRGDVAEEWTYATEYYRNKPFFLDVMHYEREPHGETWHLRDGDKFGLNTTYGYNGVEMFFHAFQGRYKSQQQAFIDKCKSVLINPEH